MLLGPLAHDGTPRDPFELEPPLHWLTGRKFNGLQCFFPKDAEHWAKMGMLTAIEVLRWAKGLDLTVPQPDREYQIAFILQKTERGTVIMDALETERERRCEHTREILTTPIQAGVLPHQSVLPGAPQDNTSLHTAVNGLDHPQVLVHADGSKFEADQPGASTRAGAAVEIWSPGGKTSAATVPLASIERRVVGRTATRGELYAIYLGLRTCRSVPEIMMCTDSEVSLTLIEKHLRKGISSVSGRTTHNDLLVSILQELSKRDVRFGTSNFTLRKVDGHGPDQPLEHHSVDLAAKRAANLPMPNNWHRTIHDGRGEPFYAVVTDGQPHFNLDFRTLLTARIKARTMAALPAHLSSLRDPMLDQRLCKKAFKVLGTGSHRRLASLLLRLRFGHVIPRCTRHVGETEQRCDHCGEIVLDDENNPVTRGSVHPATYVAHFLFSCTVHDALRAQLHSEGVTYLEAKRRKRGAGVPTLLLIRDAQKAARAQAPLAPGTMEFDPRMFFPHSTRGLLNQKGGLTVLDLVALLDCLAPSLWLMLQRAGATAIRPHVPPPLAGAAPAR